jgi:hypothetical protein
MNSNHLLVVLGDPVTARAGGISIVLAGSGDSVLEVLLTHNHHGRGSLPLTLGQLGYIGLGIRYCGVPPLGLNSGAVTVSWGLFCSRIPLLGFALAILASCSLASCSYTVSSTHTLSSLTIASHTPNQRPCDGENE